MARGTNIDLDRVIFDPEYRRNVIDALNDERPDAGGSSKRRSASGSTDLGPAAAAAMAAPNARGTELQ